MWQRAWKWLGTFLAGLVAGLLLYLGIRSKSVPDMIKRGTERATKQADEAVKRADEATKRAEAALEKSQKVIAESEQVLDEVRKRRQARQSRAKKLDGGSGTLLTIICLALVFLLYATAVHAQETVPGSYEDLRTAYLEQVKVAAEWRQLYQEAEADIIRLENEVERLQNHIKHQDGVIASLKDAIKELNNTIKEQKAWIAELYKAITDLTKRGLRVTLGALLKTNDGKIAADGWIVGVSWP